MKLVHFRLFVLPVWTVSAFTSAPTKTLRNLGRPTSTARPIVTGTEEINVVDEEEALASDASRSWKDDGFVFGLEGSGLERPQGRTSQLVVDGDSLETKPYQQAMVGLTLLAHSSVLTAAVVQGIATSGGDGVAVATTLAQAVVATVASWILADFGSGVLHWSVDNYGNGQTPVMGSIIAAFQGHHSAPWTITERGFCNNVYKLCIPFGVAPLVLWAVTTGGSVASVGATWFWSTFCIWEILSQEFHKWSHQLPRESPAMATWLQKVGVAVKRTPHALHHIAPYEGYYCIVSGICNSFLDRTGFFRWMEHMIYQRNGVAANAWKLDEELRRRTLAGDYSLPPSTSSSSA